MKINRCLRIIKTSSWCTLKCTWICKMYSWRTWQHQIKNSNTTSTKRRILKTQLTRELKFIPRNSVCFRSALNEFALYCIFNDFSLTPLSECIVTDITPPSIIISFSFSCGVWIVSQKYYQSIFYASMFLEFLWEEYVRTYIRISCGSNEVGKETN